VTFILIEEGDVWSPAPEGAQSILVAGDKIARMGAIDRRSLDTVPVEYEYIDARGCFVWPGLIDVHEHLSGGSGESGFASRTPEISLSEIVAAGITTVVGCLGTDTTTKTMPELLARAKALNEEGISAWIWSGGYAVPPVSLTGSVRRDMLLVNEVIGAGEIAVADRRSTAPRLDELARIVNDAYVGGILAGKSGVTHFHVGEGPRRLADIRELLDNYDADPGWLYPTHVERSEALMREAAELTKRGVTVDLDTVEKDLAPWLRFFIDEGGDPKHLTASSDAALNSPRTLLAQVQSCLREDRFPLELVLPLVTINPAAVLQLQTKGRVAAGMDADLAIVHAKSFELVHVIARGKRFVSDGRVTAKEAYLSRSNRRIELYGDEQ
jgi:beta-aspartyl-dipeptidase (metallo-type)